MSAVATTRPTGTRARTPAPARTRSSVRSSPARTGTGATSTRWRSWSTGSGARPASHPRHCCDNGVSQGAPAPQRARAAGMLAPSTTLSEAVVTAKKIGFLSFGAWHPAVGSTHTGGEALHQTVELAVAAEEIG